MIPTITAEAWNPREQRYREVLESEYTKDSLNETLALLWSVVGQSVPKDRDWRRVLVYSESGKTASKDFAREIIDRIRELARLLAHPPVPRMPSNFSGKKTTRAAWLAERTWAYLSLQSLARVEGERGYLRDIQSLLFLGAVHYLLPHLASQGLRSEANCLVNAMFVHALSVWPDDPGQQYYLLSVVTDYLGEDALATELLAKSFDHTPSDYHSYLTLGQSLWLNFLEAGRRKEAEKVLAVLEKNAPSRYRAEINDMYEDMQGYGKRNGS